ncbi:DUF2922 domain-containing protein [Alicyclobacillus cycloheptanicus]|uniref:DUF2922 domain-containing protein n=1 Tax=Alicyclobacillus cycloheptanicus TaxID=1457 RepID=A0ABT9XK14_9BACL|nr:DUF2922 domain-containing protein [Alicyclobacillus cycloheptanicus]MDQ0190066.1 hypothetical protein [Alicyclobacillus cycloheptanicus]WDM02046.1 DUF2922 domain-containing protein [Alicyclobacillus cycloheptanicus]
MASKATLQMEFLTDQNKKVHVNVPNPVQPIDNTAVENAMDLIVSKNIFTFSQGTIVKKVGASVIQSDTTSVG